MVDTLALLAWMVDSGKIEYWSNRQLGIGKIDL
jgi:hypothetical protein